MENSNFPKIIFTGGGSGGHLSIIKALIDYLREKDVNVNEKVLVVGGKLGMINDADSSLDEKIIPQMGVPYRLIRGGKFHRKLRWQTFTLLLKSIYGFYDSYKVIREFNPQIILGTGGYVSLPMVITGKLMGKKLFIHEQTLKGGLTNKIGSYFADKIFVSFEESKQYFPQNKVSFTGNAVRKEILEANSVPESLRVIVDNARQNNRKIIYITGGSLGSHKINKYTLENLDYLLQNFNLIWQTGSNEYHKDYEKIAKTASRQEWENRIYHSKFIGDEIGYILKNAEIVICRPGANTLYELAVVGKRAIMIPLGAGSENDQYTNAVWYKEHFTGEIIKESELTVENLAKAIQTIQGKDEINMQVNEKAEERIIDCIINS